MNFNVSLLVPLACALIYVIGALTVKRAAAFGVGVWRTSFLSNVALAVLFLPVWFLYGGEIRPWADYWQPAVTALCFFGGQALTFLALSRGDVSVTTPVMGTKVILVALFSSLLRVGEVPLQWWVGAALSTAAIGLLHLGGEARHRHVGRTVALAFGSATSFSLGDVLLQKWVHAWGWGNYFPPMALIIALLSCLLIPFFSAPLSALPAVAWRWVAPGALLMAVNNAGVVVAIVLVGSATVVNIIYSVRGLFSVLLVWLIGHWFTNDEKHLGGRVLRLRFVGATLMVAAIVLVLI
ncbi:MAG TPA: DMT family transporter [Lacunisphaera sp.]